MGFWNSGNFFMLFTGTIIVCGAVLGVTAYATSQAVFDRSLVSLQDSKTYDTGRDANGDYHPDRVCTSCGSKIHGAPGPVMGVAGAPLLAGYGAWLLWRRRSHRPA